MEEGDSVAKPKSSKSSVKPGGLMKAVMRDGGGDFPKDDDQVIFHCTTRTAEGVIAGSTRTELGGSGEPVSLVMGKSKMIKGWEEGLATIQKGEVAMLKILPELHYGDPDCPVSVPEGFPTDQLLIFEIEMLEVRAVKAITDDLAVLKQVLREGEGFETARAPYEVKARITGVANGEVFLSHREPFQFTFGEKQVPDALERAIGTMTKSEKAIIFVTGQYLSPSPAMPEIPVGAKSCEFEVELLQIVQVRDMMGDGRLIKRRIRDGKGDFPMDCPLQDSILRIHYKGMLPEEGGRVFFDSSTDGGEPLVFPSGEGLVPEGLEMCVKLMLPGEIALVSTSSDYAYEKFPRPETVPAKARVQWEVELLSFETVKDWTGFSFKEIMEDATSTRTVGNRLFKEGKFELAKAKYEKVLREFKHVNTQTDDEGREFAEMRTLLELNVAACEQKLKNYVKCIELSNKVLEINPCHVKALYRRGTAHMARGDFDEARADFQKMIDIDKAAAEDAKVALATLKKKEKEADDRARKQFEGLFDRWPGEKDEETKSCQQDDGSSSSMATAGKEVEVPEGNENFGQKADAESISYRERLARVWNTGRALLRSRKCTIL